MTDLTEREQRVLLAALMGCVHVTHERRSPWAGNSLNCCMFTLNGEDVTREFLRLRIKHGVLGFESEVDGRCVCPATDNGAIPPWGTVAHWETLPWWKDDEPCETSTH